MFLNNFSVRIPEGNEDNGYVELAHNTQYTLVVSNKRDLRCDVHIEIDGQEEGTWRINAYYTLRLERPSRDTGRFTFYKVGTPEARSAQLQEGNPNLGLVKATFTPERKPRPLVVSNYPTSSDLENTHWAGASASAGDYDDNPPVVAMAAVPVTQSATRSAGGTGLSGQSNQQFYKVNALDYDYSQQTVIHLRLVARNGNDPRPLTSFSSPVPPPVQ